MQLSKGSRRPWFIGAAIFMGIIATTIIVARLSYPAKSADLWWHIVHGRHILDSGSLIVDHSLFTWTPASAYHVYNSWLAQIILYKVDLHLGVKGLIALRYFTFFGFFFLTARYAFKRGIAGHPVSWLIILIGLHLTLGGILIKPELFSVGFMYIVVWLYYEMRLRGDKNWYLPYAYPLIFILWINLHGAFFIASLFLAMTVMGELFNLKFSPSLALPGKLRNHYLIALGLCVPALLVNPYGYELPQAIINSVLFTNVKEELSFVSAFQETSSFNSAPLYLLNYMVAAMLLFVFLLWQGLKNRKSDWVIILTFTAYCLLFVQLGRVTYFLGPVFIFASLSLLAQKQNSWLWSTSTRNNLIIAIICVTSAVFMAHKNFSFFTCSSPFSINRLDFMLDPSTATVYESANYIEENLPGTKIGNMYRDGGYLTYRFWPEKKVSIDPRAFPFNSWFDEYRQFYRGQNINAFVQKYAADTWLVRYGKVEIFQWFFLSDKWSLVFMGPHAGVFIPSGGSATSPEISRKMDDLNSISSLLLPLTTALQLSDLSLAKQLHQAAIRNLDDQCEHNQRFIEEITDVVRGVELFNDGQYQEAINSLGKPGKSIHTYGKAADAVMKLAEKSWEDGDIQGARRWYKGIFEFLPRNQITDTQAMVDVYNMTLLDWHYRHSENIDLELSESQIDWRQFVKFVLNNEDNLPAELNFVIELAKKMDQEIYDGSSRLVPRNYGSVPLSNENRSEDH